MPETLMVTLGNLANSYHLASKQGNQYTNVGFPLSDNVVLDEGFGDVINHKGLLGEQFDELLRNLQMLRVHQDVVCEIVLLQQSDAIQKGLAKQELIIGFILNLFVNSYF